MLGMRVSGNLVLVDTCRRLPGMRVLIFLLCVFFYLPAMVSPREEFGLRFWVVLSFGFGFLWLEWTGVRRRLDLQWAQTASAKDWYEGSGACV